MKIWRLDFEVDKYNSLAPKWEKDFEEIGSFNGIRKKDNWIPLEMKKADNLPGSNAPGLVAGIPVFDEKTVSILKDLIEDEVEILPLDYAGGNYYIINVIQVLDCIDYERSTYKTFSDGKKIMRFIEHVFYEDKVRNKNIFKIIDKPRSWPFVSDTFRERVLENHLTGFEFELVWDSEDLVE